VLTTVLAQDSHRTIIDAVDMGLHVATIAAVLGAAASLIRHR
jgi:hypothetical protein